VERRVAISCRLIDVGVVQEQQLDKRVVTLPRAVVQRTQVYNEPQTRRHSYRRHQGHIGRRGDGLPRPSSETRQSQILHSTTGGLLQVYAFFASPIPGQYVHCANMTSPIKTEVYITYLYHNAAIGGPSHGHR